MIKTTEQFIIDAINIHGDKYDYSKVIYKKAIEKVKIICPEHGEFLQSPNTHLSGRGCWDCGHQPKSTEHFIKEAINIHGDKYDYSKVNYKGNNIKITIICKDHGEFYQRPFNHIISKQGCPICGNINKSIKLSDTKEIFIEKAKKVHDNKYDYCLVNYKGSETPIKIICKKHGIFTQTPTNHLTNHGCHECAGNLKKTTERFILDAIKVHGNKYNYSKVDYLNASTKIIIICTEHGEFEQTPNSHLVGQGCPTCSNIKIGLSLRMTTEEFIDRAREIHGDTFDYSKTIYGKNTTEEVLIGCKIHGDFWQMPHSHLLGHKCPKCSGNYMDTPYFKEKSIEIHGYKYDYSLVDYVHNNKKIKIICPKHGIFEQKPRNHLNGYGCTKCKQSKPEAFIDSWLTNNGHIFKREKRFHDCRYKLPLPFDFYLTEHNICIEYDGQLHYTKHHSEKNDERLRDRQRNDKIKTNYCINNNIPLIRIRYDENIVDKLKNSLNKLIK